MSYFQQKTWFSMSLGEAYFPTISEKGAVALGEGRGTAARRGRGAGLHPRRTS